MTLILIILIVLIIFSVFYFFSAPPINEYENQPIGNDEIQIITPRQNSEISSPLHVTGSAKGTWFFEASFPVQVYDSDLKLLGYGIVSAKDDWMTENFVPFSGDISFEDSKISSGWVRFKKDNPSGLAENDASFDVPVVFSKGKTKIQVYFGKYSEDSSMNACTNMVQVTRYVQKTQAIGQAALEELLNGPSDSEKNSGLFTSIPEGVVVKSLKIENGTATVDFNGKMNAGGSCRVLAIRTQIEKTLKQFPSVSNVIISVDGNVDEALQP